MASTTMTQDEVLYVTVGVDTHKDSHVARAKDQLGRRLGAPKVVDTTSAGYRELLEWVGAWGRSRCSAYRGHRRLGGRIGSLSSRPGGAGP